MPTTTIINPNNNNDMTINEEFKVQAVCPISNYGGWELQVSKDGQYARVRMNNGDNVTEPCKWRRIRYTRDGDSYIVYLWNTLYFSNFQKV